MKHHSRLGSISLAIILTLALAACQTASTPSAAQQTSTAESAAAATKAAITPIFNLPTVAATAEPYILEGATTTASGLQYLEVKAGNGPAPQVGDIVTMHYIASMPDGTQLYDSHTTDQPATVTWGSKQLLAGWEEGVGLMKEGETAKLVLPPELAFGAQGSNSVPPNSTIILEVELLSVKPAPAPSEVSATKLQMTDTGLQYYDLTVGSGTEAVTNSVVTTNYTIWIQAEPKPTYIASSTDTSPLTFVVGRHDTVFPGWEEGVIGMKVGGKRYLMIPSELGLGEQGGGMIPPNAVMIMEIELTDTKDAPTMTKVDEKDYVTTASGLKYYDIQVGTGVTPTVGQTVVVQYAGWLTDGTMFDSSITSGQPFTFQLGMGNVIPGWDEGIATMKVGGKRQLVVPAALGYGDSGAGSVIPPGATLIFDVELLEIKP